MSSHFFEIKNTDLISRVLNIAYKFKHTVTIWTKDQTIKFDTKIVESNKKTKMLYLYLTGQNKKIDFDEILKDQKVKLVFANVLVDKVMFFFKTEYVQKTDLNLLQIKTPEVLFKLQRRSTLRVPFNRNDAPKVTFLDPEKNVGDEDIEYIQKKFHLSPEDLVKNKILLQVRALDISTGGLSFAISPENIKAYKAGTEIRNISFALKGKKITVHGVVRHLKEALNDRKQMIYKIGIKFEGLNLDDEKHIARFVLDGSRTLFSVLTTKS